jgi:hypothetical protein
MSLGGTTSDGSMRSACHPAPPLVELAVNTPRSQSSAHNCSRRRRFNRDKSGQAAHLSHQDSRFGVEVDGVADDLDARLTHKVERLFLAAFRVDKVTTLQAEDRAVCEQLIAL